MPNKNPLIEAEIDRLRNERDEKEVCKSCGLRINDYTNRDDRYYAHLKICPRMD